MIFLELFLTFFKIGALTFGGGYAMLPLIQQQVLEKQWLDEQSIVDFIAVSESTPGPFAINISTYIGSQMGGIPGAACATLGVVLPSFIVILVIAGFYKKFKNSKIVEGVMTGLRPCVVGLISAAVLSVATTVFIPKGFSTEIFSSPDIYIAAVISVVSAILAFKKVHPVIIICLCALAGIVKGLVL